ncbi:MAG: sodium-dependent transporter, partial [Ruminococcus sp.]
VKKNGWGWKGFIKEANTGTGLRFPSFLRIHMTYFIPAVICVIYLKGYYDMFADKGLPMLTCWMSFAVILLIMILCICIFSKPQTNHE